MKRGTTSVRRRGDPTLRDLYAVSGSEYDVSILDEVRVNPELAKKMRDFGWGIEFPLFKVLRLQPSRELVERMCDACPEALNEVDLHGNSPVYVAEIYGVHADVIDALKQKIVHYHPSVAQFKNDFGLGLEYPLFDAIRHGASHSLVVLMCDTWPQALGDRDPQGHTPIQLARKCEANRDVLDALEQRMAQSSSNAKGAIQGNHISRLSSSAGSHGSGTSKAKGNVDNKGKCVSTCRHWYYYSQRGEVVGPRSSASMREMFLSGGLENTPVSENRDGPFSFVNLLFPSKKTAFLTDAAPVMTLTQEQINMLLTPSLQDALEFPCSLDNDAICNIIMHNPSAAGFKYRFRTRRRGHTDLTPEVYPLLRALQIKASLKVVELLCDFFPDALQQVDHRGKTPLHLAIIAGCPSDIVVFLCERQPEAMIRRDSAGLLPLHYALRSINTSVKVKNAGLLINHAPAVALREKNESGETPLHVAAIRVAEAWAKTIVQKCPQALNEKANNGQVPLHCLFYRRGDQVKVSLNQVSLVKIFIERYDDALMHQDRVGRTPLDIARSNPKTPREIIDLLSTLKSLFDTAMTTDQALEVLRRFISEEWWGGVALVLKRQPSITFKMHERMMPHLLSYVGQRCGAHASYEILRQRPSLIQNAGGALMMREAKKPRLTYGCYY